MIDINATLIAQMLNFLILVVLLRAVAYKPIVKMLKEREDNIANNLKQAEDDKAEAKKALEQYQAQLADARVQAQEIMDKAEKRARDEKAAKLQETNQEIAEIQREQARAVEKLKGDMVTLSLAAAQKIVSKNIDVAENEALISEFIDQLDKNKIGDLPC